MGDLNTKGNFGIILSFYLGISFGEVGIDRHQAENLMRTGLAWGQDPNDKELKTFKSRTGLFKELKG